MIILGRILQGLAAGSIMPSTMALFKVYWEGPAHQRAVSMWSIGSWGGSGLTAIFGGFMASTALGWHSIFIMCTIVSVLSILLMRRIPESVPLAGREGKTDWIGIITMAVGLTALLIVVTHTLHWQYTVLAVIAYSLFGLGLAFYATPSTDAALTNLPDDKTGAGSGIYKMASSLDAAFGVVVSAVIFTALSESGLDVVGAAFELFGRQDNLAIREAGMVGLVFNGLMAIAALFSIIIFIPKEKTSKDLPSMEKQTVAGKQ